MAWSLVAGLGLDDVAWSESWWPQDLICKKCEADKKPQEVHTHAQETNSGEWSGWS